jgi:glucose/arabinose dehydrogenase
MPFSRVPLAALAAVAIAPGTHAQARGPSCAPDNAGLTLPPGFCALVVADSVGRPRHLVAAANGDLFVALTGNQGGVLALRDADGDGMAEVRRQFGVGSGSGIALSGGYLYFGTDFAVVRWPWPEGRLEPAGAPDTIVSGLLSRRQHAAKTIAIGRDGALYVNIGAPSNSCQDRDRQPGSRGLDPCGLLDSAGGIWRFDPGRLRQTQRDGSRFATGLRNVVALAADTAAGALYGAQHGRDDLARLWPDLFTPEQNAEKPAEELFRLEQGGDYGWPYCYFDPELDRKVLSPEYGGDGRSVGRCAGTRRPVVAFPAHWAPNAIAVYHGSQFPPEYRGGIFLAFHGSWNRAPLPQQGFNVVFQPMSRGQPGGRYRVFADGFRGSGDQAEHRPTGLAVGPDGSLYVTDDRGGRIYRILYRGP